MESRRDVFQAIADPTRRAILTLLAVQALTPLPTISNHHGKQFQSTFKYLPSVNCLKHSKTAGKFTITSTPRK
jgi:DNA-binding transcriptional ArsR family regulator